MVDKLSWDQRYRQLAFGEIIEAGDECRRDDGTWVTGICVGEPAPDPAYTSHRVYRRLKATPANGEQVERVEGLIHKRFPRADAQTVIALASDILATLPTPTQDARERVKALEEALREAHDTLHECTAVLTANDCAKVAAVMSRARTALGNKETDCHG